MNANEITVVLGDEHDEGLRRLVEDVLGKLGAESSTHVRGVGGSQDMETLEVEIDGQRLVVEAETYVGLSIHGPPELVRRVESQVKTLAASKP
ncbi:hypothetical protein G6O69_16635 [Pseudenhygromyxa sp. WMMC2535]|uniref:hypothetical protein n=1 Tax=Pseudenhygromyxa sp. WMMC2535 TaxID=2712867 RepID=UPI00155167A9|nr:hypothetical protein [Pseudenhygromyxa sp. WMMC2535]NVB39471.1 hypothetical protein [Pseudenhygromyxa sp. WMMC2535]